MPRPTPTPDTYLWDILRAIALRISLIEHLPEIHVRQVFARWTNDPEDVTVITPEEDDFDEVAGFLNTEGRRTQGVNYGIRVGVLSQKNDPFEDLDPWILYWRLSLRQRLNEPKLRTLDGIEYNANLELGPINDETAQRQGWNGTSFRVIISSIEPATGLLASNQEG